MRTKLFVLSFMLLAGCIVVVFLSFMTPPRDLPKTLASDLARELYVLSKEVPLSKQLGAELTDIAAARSECYRRTPEGRTEACAGEYLNAVVAAGKRSINSAPDMGAFIHNVSRCPVVHSLCMGEFFDPGRCLRMEAQCIEGILDRYWRGRPFQGH